MKRFAIVILIICVCFLLFWGGSIINASYLTVRYADEFSDHSKMNYDFMHAWDEPVNLRVLSYSSEYATVYFFSNSGGEKIKFIRGKYGWVYRETLAIWSRQGNADDYFIWPYFKNYVP